jgi:RecB family exonuclease
MSRGSHDEDFNPLKVSPSRINAYASCGVAFKFKYIDHMRATKSGSAALFGNVVHKALESWALNREANLLTLMRAAWLTCTEGTILNDFIGAYSALSTQAIKQEHAIREAWAAQGKESKAPRMTKEWKESDVAKKINTLWRTWGHRFAGEDCPYIFSDRDPITSLYDESLVLAKRYEMRNRNRPNAIYTELSFDVKWQGFLLNGYIDAIEPVISADGEILGYDVTDYKTYRQESPGAKDWRQGVIYDVAVRGMVQRGELDLDVSKLRIVFDYPRLAQRKAYNPGGPDYAQLLEELRMYQRGVEAGVFMPADKGRNPDFCDFPANCCLIQRPGGCVSPVLLDEAA